MEGVLSGVLAIASGCALISVVQYMPVTSYVRFCQHTIRSVGNRNRVGVNCERSPRKLVQSQRPNCKLARDFIFYFLLSFSLNQKTKKTKCKAQTNTSDLSTDNFF